VITKSTARWVAGIAALALFGAACGGASSPEAVEQAESVPATEAPSGDVTSDQAPDATTPAVDGQAGAETDSPAVAAPETLQFTAPLVGGGEIDLAANFDNKPTLLWFWAPN